MLEIRKLEIRKKTGVGAGDLDGQSCFLHRSYLYGQQDNTNLHEILTDIAVKGSLVEAILRMRF